MLEEFTRRLQTDDAYADDDNLINRRWGTIFVIYFVYIIGLILAFFLLDKCRVFDKFIHEFSLRSQENLFPLLEILDEKKEEEERQNHRPSISLPSLPEIASGPDPEFVDETPCCDCCCRACCGSATEDSKLYRIKYVNYLVKQPSYLASQPIHCKKTTAFNWKSISVTFAPGLWNDYLFYVLNNHSILSMALSTRGHPFSRAEKRSAFFCLNCVAVAFSVFVTAMQLGSTGSAIFNVFIVSPVMTLLNRGLYYMLACPCTMKMREKSASCARLAYLLNSVGYVVLLPLASMCVVFLVTASLFNRGGLNSAGYHIASFAYSVHVVSAFQEVAFSALKVLNGRLYLKFYLFNCLPVFSMGEYFKEKVKLGLEENVDYVTIERTRVCCGLFAYCGFISKETPSGSVLQTEPTKEEVADLVDESAIADTPHSSADAPALGPALAAPPRPARPGLPLQETRSPSPPERPPRQPEVVLDVEAPARPPRRPEVVLDVEAPARPPRPPKVLDVETGSVEMTTPEAQVTVVAESTELV